MSVTDELKLKSKIEQWLLRENEELSKLSPKMQTIIKYCGDIGNERIAVSMVMVAAACLDEDMELAAKVSMNMDGKGLRVGFVTDNSNSHNYRIDSMVVRVKKGYFIRPDGSQGNHLENRDLRPATKEEVEEFLESAKPEWLAAVEKLAT